MSVNKVILVGNLGKDPESRSKQDGGKVVNISVATSETWTDRASGERRENTEWHRVVIFNERAAEFVEKYLRKGAKVYVEGALKTRKWTDANGQERYTTEIVVSQYNGEVQALDKRTDNGSEANGTQAPASNPAPATGADLDDEIPF